MTLFASSSNAVTFNYEAGDISYIPATFGHYIENTGNTTLKYLEIWNSSTYFHRNSHSRTRANHSWAL